MTSISLMARRGFRQRVIGGSKLVFSKSVPKAFVSPWLKKNSALHEVPEHPNSYAKVRVVLRARSTREAMERGFFGLDYLRGVWNFALGFRRYRLTFGGIGNKPFNSILLGPQFSVHTNSGALIEEEFGVIGNFHEARPVSNVDAIRTLAVWDRKVHKKLEVIGHRKVIEAAFVRYARVLDETDQDSCLLGLWSLIELLTGTVDARFEVTIRRAANLYSSPEPHRSVLQHLREHRNGIAHSGRESEMGELLIAEAKHFVEQLLDFHLVQGRHFESFEESCQFLDFPVDCALLKRHIDLRRLALNLRKGAERKAANPAAPADQKASLPGK
ncbi:MAG: hypothetical protein ABIS20_22385 [Thermoanaerobaculia bacterium]